MKTEGRDRGVRIFKGARATRAARISDLRTYFCQCLDALFGHQPDRTVQLTVQSPGLFGFT